MTTQKKNAVVAVGLTAVVAALLWCCTGIPSKLWRQADLAWSGPPLGSTEPEVRAWIARRQLRLSSEWRLDDVDVYPAQGATFRGILDLDPSAEGFVTYGSEESSSLWRGWVRVYFYFGPDGRLAKTAIRYWEGYF